jgi:hypothetical protein
MPFNISLLFIIPAYSYIINNRKIIVLLRDFKYELFILLILTGYVFIRGFIFGSDTSFFFGSLFFLIQIFPVSIWLYYYFSNFRSLYFNQNENGFIIYLGIIAIIASLISIFCFIYPDFGYNIKFEILKYDERLWRYQSNRAFGLSDELLFSYSLVQGIILICMISITKNIKIILTSFILIIISIILNARIGLIILVFLPFILIKNHVFLKSIISAFLIFLLLNSSLISELLPNNFNYNIDYALRFFRGTVDYFSGNKTYDSGNYEALFGRMIVLPNTLSEWIFGTGENIFLRSGRSSDIGYILMLNFGGIIHLALFCLLSIFMFYRLIRSNSGLRIISYTLIFVFVISNIKGLFFAPKPGMKLFLIIYVFFILNKYESNKFSLKDE